MLYWLLGILGCVCTYSFPYQNLPYRAPTTTLDSLKTVVNQCSAWNNLSQQNDSSPNPLQGVEAALLQRMVDLCYQANDYYTQIRVLLESYRELNNTIARYPKMRTLSQQYKNYPKPQTFYRR